MHIVKVIPTETWIIESGYNFNFALKFSWTPVLGPLDSCRLVCPLSGLWRCHSIIIVLCHISWIAIKSQQLKVYVIKQITHNIIVYTYIYAIGNGWSSRMDRHLDDYNHLRYCRRHCRYLCHRRRHRRQDKTISLRFFGWEFHMQMRKLVLHCFLAILLNKFIG